MGQAYKMQAVREIMAKENGTLDEIAYVGDDIIDLPVMRRCGLAIAVANAREQVKAAGHFTTEHSGGHGAGRDAVEFILKAKGVLDEIIENISTNAIRFQPTWISAKATPDICARTLRYSQSEVQCARDTLPSRKSFRSPPCSQRAIAVMMFCT